MASKNKKFVYDGWAVWIEGEDVSTVYLNDWIDPKGHSYIDIAVKIKGISKSRSLNIFIPFDIEREEIKATDEEVEKRVEEMATAQGKPVPDVKKNINARQLDYIKNDIIIKKFFDFLKTSNTIE